MKLEEIKVGDKLWVIRGDETVPCEVVFVCGNVCIKRGDWLDTAMPEQLYKTKEAALLAQVKDLKQRNAFGKGGFAHVRQYG